MQTYHCPATAPHTVVSSANFPYRKSMDADFTSEQETQLTRIAAEAGTSPELLVTKVMMRCLDEQTRFLAAVERGIAAADRGDFIEEEEMDARLEAMFKV